MVDDLTLIPGFRSTKCVMDEIARKACKTCRQLPAVEIPGIRNGFRLILAKLSVVFITTTHDPVTGNATKHRLLFAGWLVNERDLQLSTCTFSLANDLLPPVPSRILKLGLLLGSCQIKQGEYLIFLLRSKHTKLLPQVSTLDLKGGSQQTETFSPAPVAGESCCAIVLVSAPAHG
jgi:hypothetical protein